MKNSYLALICGVLLFVILSMAWCKPRPATQSSVSPAPSAPPPVSSSPALSPATASTPVPSPTASPKESQSPELRKSANKAAPAVILVSVFDASGKLLRTGTGFFISEDGQFIASRSLVEGGVNAIANTADKKIYNVAGVLAESPELDLAVLKAETKQVPFLPLSKPVAAEDGARVAVIGSPLSRREGKVSEGTITARRTDDKGEWLDLSTPIENDAAGSPVLTERGEVLGIVTSDRSKNPPVNTVLASATVQSFLAKIDPAATAQWAGASPSPTKSPKVRRKIVFRRSPTYPTTVDARALRGSGSYRIIFDATGRAKNVQIVRSTGGEAFDRAAVTALQQWRSEPGQEWSIVIPVSFQPRAN